MSVAALVLAAAAAAAPAPQVVSAQASVEIVKPVRVRQASGPIAQADMPAYQLTRSGNAVLVEFQ